ncbi:MAG: hypothetical protein MI974_16230 [Chitinophagales bacterium]|nr:hypothetical protein [Chitinophagales bacterium]
MMYVHIYLVVLILLVGQTLIGQELIALTNPSLEDKARVSRVPHGWQNCGFEEESPPDTHPGGFFGVNKLAVHGNTYVGLVARDNDSWECIGQALESPLLKDSCYQLAFMAAQSDSLISGSREQKGLVNYINPCKIRLWAGFQHQDGYELLAETDPIEHQEWKEYILTFVATKNYNYLYVEVYYTGITPYCGHVLIDHFSKIVPCNMLSSEKTIRDF